MHHRPIAMSDDVCRPDEHPYIHADHYIPALLSKLNNHLSSVASHLYLKHFNIGLHEWRILSVLSNTPASNATHIGETVHMHKAVVSRGVRDLQAKGLLTIDKADGQRTMSLTPAGQAMHDRVAQIALQREVLLLSDLSAEEQAQLRNLLIRMSTSLARVDAWDPIAEGDADAEGPGRPAASACG